MIHKQFDIFKDKRHGVYQIRTKTQVLAVEFSSEEERSIFEEVCLDDKNRKISHQKLFENLSKKYNKDKILKVIANLKDYGIYEEDADAYDAEYDKVEGNQIKFWSRGMKNFGFNAIEVQQAIADAKVVVMGEGTLFDNIIEKMKKSGFKKMIAVDTSKASFEKISDMFSLNDLVIAEANNWNPTILNQMNSCALISGTPWLLVRGIYGTSLSVGPLFIKDDTGCYNCLMSRIKSNMQFLPYFEEYEKFLKESGSVSKNDGAPKVSYDILSSIVSLEAVKYITGWTIPTSYKAFINFSLLDYSFNIQPFVKAPFCEACSPQVEFNPAPWLEPVTIK